MKLKLAALAAAIPLVMMTSAAIAGSYSCMGKVTVGAEQSRIDQINSSPEHTCLFATNSKAGRKILKQCPDGSECSVELPLPLHGGVPEERVTTIKPTTPIDVQRLDAPAAVQADDHQRR